MASSPGTPLYLADDGAMITAISAFQSAHYLEMACFTLLVYDLLTTFGEEVDYFWSGPWSVSRVLFFLNRYLPLVIMMCTRWIHAAFELSTLTVCINQGILFLRVWYMYSHSALARAAACFSYAACTVSSMVLLGLSLPSLESYASSVRAELEFFHLPGCSAPSPSMIWRVFLPSMVIHTILFGFTIARVMQVSHKSRMDHLMPRLVRDGGLVFFVSMASATFSAVGARSVWAPIINAQATWSNSQLAISAVAVSRLMLSIRSLAGKLGINQDWVFNPSELSRVNWRAVYSDHGHSIVVEMETHEPVLSTSDPGCSKLIY
ncbi:hypothetical protein AZE42_05659 [Rhizopogon vesiculosus]|uniref:DUF6533 domain-containing protein n=1 Tax=Rhizopogon vesiculosus TaxID=180088 RepID=A0A1J8R6R8_9AGAM|nr:hypothetical protein AZE42_05659 [Rhizopogon vesiculosus]